MSKLNRRSFLQSAAALAGASICPTLLDSVRAAFQIEPSPGSTFLDAEHIVFLMQENRSFDHCFGTMRGVRGFNDPRAIELPNGLPVWLQTDVKGGVYTPFHLDIHNTCSTYTGYLPHAWLDQQEARNGGKYNHWLVAKQTSKPDLAHIPLTLGYHTRSDIPFYYALADAFTICDQHFCSALTGTIPNRLYFWTGSIRSAHDPEAPANVRNEDSTNDHEHSWTTFPERLSEHGISWRVYQNEIGIKTGLAYNEDRFLSNFEDNPLEVFSQYRVRFKKVYSEYIKRRKVELPGLILAAAANLAETPLDAPDYPKKAKYVEAMKRQLQTAIEHLESWHPDKISGLSPQELELHERAFTTNKGDPNYRQVSYVSHHLEGEERSITLPSGDVFHQFRQDVDSGKLPTVSWLVAPEAFSDHPTSPWNGAWYVSEALKILTRNPEIWKKTIFILNYDENDGYFDHVPPYVAAAPGRPETGGCSAGVDTSCEFGPAITPKGNPEPIGLGYRVPMIVASPWTRGGWVNSQVFDLTSPLRFLEQFLSQKFKKEIRETNLTTWRRAVCGDLTSLFRPWSGELVALPDFLKRDDFMVGIEAARYKPLPSAGQPLSHQEVEEIQNHPERSARLPRQEAGTRVSCALPYELSCDGVVSPDLKSLKLVFEAAARNFGEKAAGAPFQVHAVGRFARVERGASGEILWEEGHVWDYAVAAGERVEAEWALTGFPEGRYHLRVYGPNGFYREFKGGAGEREFSVRCEQEALSRRLVLNMGSPSAGTACAVILKHHAYGYPEQILTVFGKETGGVAGRFVLDLEPSSGWYDFSVGLQGAPYFERRYAGRIEDGTPSVSDPVMG